MIDDINTDIKRIDEYFRSNAEKYTERERTYARMVKLNEEVGELCEAILYENDPHQRHKGKPIDLDSELADVIICSLLMANGREKDVWDEVRKKLDKQLKRFNL